MDDAAGSQRPHVAGLRGLPVHHRGQPVPAALPDADRGRSGDPHTPDDDVYQLRTDRHDRRLERDQRRGRRLGELDGPAGRRAAARRRQVELSITYASDFFVQGRGVILDEVVVSTGDGSTGFEADGNPLDGWTTPAAPDPNQPNPNTWTTSGFVPHVAGTGGGRVAVVRPAAGDHRLGGGPIRSVPVERVGSGSSRRGPSGSHWRTRRDRSTRRSSSAKRATTSSSSTSSPTSGSATFSRSTRGTRPG